MTLALYGLLAVLLIGAIYLVAALLLPAGEQIAPAVRDEPIWSLPAERSLVAADVADVRLPVALRGYRFAETDLLLDRLVEELRARDEELARLRNPATRSAPSVAEAGERFAEHETLAASSPEPTKSPSLVKATTEGATEPERDPGIDVVSAAAARSRAESGAAQPEPTPDAVAEPQVAPAPRPAVAAAPKPRRVPARKTQPAPPSEPGGHDG
ncbi:MAG: DivIVA domain-containing protein [Pseudonocardiales bacterium]